MPYASQSHMFMIWWKGLRVTSVHDLVDCGRNDLRAENEGLGSAETIEHNEKLSLQVSEHGTCMNI